MTDVRTLRVLAERAGSITGSASWEVVDGNKVSVIKRNEQGRITGGMVVCIASIDTFAELVVAANPPALLELLDEHDDLAARYKTAKTKLKKIEALASAKTVDPADLRAALEE